jgi:general secretion pathway protein J
VAARLVSGGRPRGPRADARGFTLIEVVLALAILATVVLLGTAALRTGLRSWEAGQRRADAQQEMRALVELLGEALAGAYPYRGRGRGTERPVLFEGEAEEVRFVTTAPPLALDGDPVPFHAVVLGLGERGELRLVEHVVPAEDPFAPGPGMTLSRAVTRFRLQYQDGAGAWQEEWVGRDAEGLPAAVRLELTVGSGGGARALPPLVVPLALGKRRS